MPQAHIESLLMVLGLAGEILLATLMVRKGLFRVFPLFTSYIIFSAMIDGLGYFLFHQAQSLSYFYTYCAENTLDYTLQLFVLFEIAHAVLNPVRRALPRYTLAILIGAVLFSALVALFAAPHLRAFSGQRLWDYTLLAALLLALLRVAVFLVISVFSQMLGIGWKSHVLQLASGFAFYGIVSVSLQLSISHLSQGTHGASLQMRTLNELELLAYIGTLAFWIWSFSQNEAPRKEFTPQMQAVLVTIAGTARRTRIAVTRTQGQK